MASHLEWRYIGAYRERERSMQEQPVPRAAGGVSGGKEGGGYPAARGGTGTHHPCVRERAMRKLPIFLVTLLPPSVFWMWRRRDPPVDGRLEWKTGEESLFSFSSERVSVPQTKVVGVCCCKWREAHDKRALVLLFIFFLIGHIGVVVYYFLFCNLYLLAYYFGWNRLFVFPFRKTSSLLYLLLFVYFFPATNILGLQGWQQRHHGWNIGRRSFVAFPCNFLNP